MINIGVIGLGYWGVNYVRNFNLLPDARVSACCDVDVERLERVTQEIPVIKITTDFRDLLSSGRELDAVVIATPASTHYQIARLCLQNRKHVLIEKPMTLNVEEGRKLIELAETQGIILMVGHTFLYHPAIRKLKEYLQDTNFGSLYYIHSTTAYSEPRHRDINAVWDLAPHDLSIISYLLETQPIRIGAIGAHYLNNGREDVAFLNLNYPNGIVASIRLSWVDFETIQQVVVVGSRRRIVFDELDTLKTIKVFQKGVMGNRPVQCFGEHQYSITNLKFSAPLMNQCYHFLDCIRNKTQPLSDGENGLEVVRVLCAADESLEKGGIPVEINSRDEN